MILGRSILPFGRPPVVVKVYPIENWRPLGPQTYLKLGREVGYLANGPYNAWLISRQRLNQLFSLGEEVVDHKKTPAIDFDSKGQGQQNIAHCINWLPLPLFMEYVNVYELLFRFKWCPFIPPWIQCAPHKTHYRIDHRVWGALKAVCVLCR